MAALASELEWVVHFAPVVRFTPLSPKKKNTKNIARSGVGRYMLIFIVFEDYCIFCKVNGPHAKGSGHFYLPIIGKGHK